MKCQAKRLGINLEAAGKFSLRVNRATRPDQKTRGQFDVKCGCQTIHQISFNGFDDRLPDWRCDDCGLQLTAAVFREILQDAEEIHSKKIRQFSEAN